MTVVVIGAGGHAKVVVATLQAAGRSIAGIYDDDRSRHGAELMGIPIRGPVEEAVRAGLPMLIAVGDNRARRELARRLQGEFATAVHPTAVVHPSCRIGPGSVVFAGAVIQPDSILGEHVIVNTAASIDHDCRVGAFSHLGPGVRLCGSVTLGEGALLGVAAAAVPGSRIGEWSVVGAGAVVTKYVEPGLTVVGIPARPRS
ncbi:MAG TPA: NeuD/PglB/VioB family sugar acetyltransferase [Thermoanaerobaculia bacterium]|nr:NeuD/PglB/VioB family sugar acetyltransferase [Thermoanaerobaculia bacterium]